MHTADTYIRHALTVELAHPRFGGTHELLLSRFNQIYRRFGLETVTTDGPGSVPFTQLRAQATESISEGPLVSVIMSCWSPGEELLLAVRSVIDQSYQNWELLVTDDASPAEFGHVLDQVASMDPRIRVVRNDVNAGTYIRRNEALDLANGDYVTMQDSDDWSHPRRLEIQVRDLQDSPHRYANIVYNVRLTEDLSLYSERGMQLGLCEPAIMFRRESVLSKVGYFDDVRKAADREFRQRLEAATGVPVAVVGPEIPLVLMRADVGSLSGSDFRGKWVHPARVAYRSSMLRAHVLISDGEQPAVFPSRQTSRVLDAPEALLGRNTAPAELDLLVVLDGRPNAGRVSFLAGVVEEVRAALRHGLVVGVMHFDSIQGGRQQGYFDKSLQRLVDEEGLYRIINGQKIAATTVVVRHASAVQGHPAEGLPVTATRVLIVEDPSGGDERGGSFAKSDVTHTVRTWFGIEPSWHTATSRPLPPTVESVMVDEAELRFTIRHARSGGPVSVELLGTRSLTLPLKEHKRGALNAGDDTEALDVFTSARIPLTAVGDKPFQLVAEVDSYRYVLEVETSRVLTMSAERALVRRASQKLQLLGGEGVDNQANGTVGALLQARVRDLQIERGRMRLAIEVGEDVRLTRVVAIRDVRGRLRRRGLALKAVADGTFLASRQLMPLADLRWQIFGVFQTPVGRIQHPLIFNDDVREAAGDGWFVQRVGGHVVQVVSSEQRPSERRAAATRANRPLARWWRFRTRSV